MHVSVKDHTTKLLQKQTEAFYLPNLLQKQMSFLVFSESILSASYTNKHKYRINATQVKQFNTMQYNTIQYNTIQYYTYNAMQCNEMQSNLITVQLNTKQLNAA